MFTKQQTFDTVAVHLVQQGEPSILRGSKSPRYYLEREGKVLRCAIGCLIPGDSYHAFVEGKTVGTLLKSEQLADLQPVRKVLAQHDERLLVRLQCAHDSQVAAVGSDAEWLRECVAELRGIAKLRGLSTEALDAALEARS